MAMRIQALPAASSRGLALICEGMNLANRQSRYQGHERPDVRACDGATQRFYKLVWPHAQTVLRAAHYLMHNPAEADDIAQETMIKAFRAIDSFEAGTDIRAWLMTILRNTRIDHIRAAASAAGNVSLEQLGTEPVDRSHDAESDDDAAWDEPEELLEEFSDAHIIQALRALPEEIRWTLLLVEVEGMDHEDAAKILDVPVGTVKSRAFRGRAMLRKSLLPLTEDFRPDRHRGELSLVTLQAHEHARTQPETQATGRSYVPAAGEAAHGSD